MMSISNWSIAHAGRGTEGTRWCNYGGACGYLTVDGYDVGDTLLAENLAHRCQCPFEPAQ